MLAYSLVALEPATHVIYLYDVGPLFVDMKIIIWQPYIHISMTAFKNLKNNNLSDNIQNEVVIERNSLKLVMFH